MRSLRSFSIRYKILLVVAVAVLGFTANLVFNYMVTNSNANRLSRVQEIYYPTLERIDANRVRLNQIKQTMNDAVTSAEIDALEETDEMAQAMRTTFNEVRELDPEVAGSIDRMSGLFSDYYKAARELTTGMIQGTLHPVAMKSSVDAMRKALEDLDQTMGKFRNASYARFTESIQAASNDSELALKVGLIISLLVIAVVGFTGFVVSGMVSKNILNVVGSLRGMASDGDLTKRLESSGNDEIGQLVNSFNTLAGKLQELIGEIVGSIAQLASAAEEMSAISEEANNSVSKQQMETEQVATAMNAMASSVQGVALNATQAAEAAYNAEGEANGGRQVVEEAINLINALAGGVETAAGTIQQLKRDSENIGGVLNVIRSVSEQTNLLALNAAIEAARAGEQGRGFAVVADEVRTLANRTQESTREIQKMIESLQSGASQAVEAMEQGRTQAQVSVEQAAKAGESLRAITDGIATINDMNTQTASTAEEQRSVAEEINRNVTNISQLGNQTADGAKQTAASSKELAELAVRLQLLAGQFKV